MEQEEQEQVFNEKTIDVMKAGRPRKVRVREIPIKWEGKDEVVLIKKMSFGERAEYAEKFINIKIHGKVQDISLKYAEMMIQAVLMGVQEAPFPVTEDYIRHELDGEIGEKLNYEIEKYNKLSEDMKKNFDGQSSTEVKIQE